MVTSFDTAFNYPAISARLIKAGIATKNLEFILQVEREELVCETGYLKGRITIDKFVKIY